MFIAIEGVDAAGKATQAKILADRLGARLFSFPDYASPVGHLILGHLKCYWSALPDEGSVDAKIQVGDVDVLNAKVYQLLQVANRMEHAAELDHLIAQGRHIVADRYWASSVAYGQACGLDPVWLTHIHEYLPQPDLNLLLDIDPGQSSERRPERRDRHEKQPGLMEAAAVAYRQLWRTMADRYGWRRWVVIDGRGTIGEVTDRVWDIVEPTL